MNSGQQGRLMGTAHSPKHQASLRFAHPPGPYITKRAEHGKPVSEHLSAFVLGRAGKTSATMPGSSKKHFPKFPSPDVGFQHVSSGSRMTSSTCLLFFSRHPRRRHAFGRDSAEHCALCSTGHVSAGGSHDPVESFGLQMFQQHVKIFA